MSGSEDRRPTLYCSFCGKSQNEVARLIAGPTVFICDECIVLCMDIVKDEEAIKRYRESLKDQGSVIVEKTQIDKLHATIANLRAIINAPPPITPPLTTSLERFEAFHKGPTNA